jgi:sugar phosphate isomerase/epimerase
VKLGVFTVILGDLPLDQALSYLKSQGVQELEIGVGGNPGTAHGDARRLLAEPAELEKFKATIEASGLRVAALSVHGNPVHPNAEIARRDHEDFTAAVLVAEKLNIPTGVTFSGCPGDSDQALYPNWVVASWPTEHQIVKEWQWNEKLIPYWQKAGKFAQDHGVRVAIEMHPVSVSTTPPRCCVCAKLWALRSAPILILPTFSGRNRSGRRNRQLRGAIYHFHAKDTKIDPINCAAKGVLETSKLDNLGERPWIFRSVGYGHDEATWRAIFPELRLAGYNGIISIEHEDGLMTPREGLEKAIEVLKRTIIFEDETVEMFWRKSKREIACRNTHLALLAMAAWANGTPGSLNQRRMNSGGGGL